MSLAELYLNPTPSCFGGSCVERSKAKVCVLGVPYDGTTSWRSGAREAPQAIRVAAANIEFYSLRLDVDVEEVPIADVGDLAVSFDVKETLRRVSTVVYELLQMLNKQLLVVLGGEHTITLGVFEGLMKAGLDPCLLVFDAHLDCRDEYMGSRLTHATFARRLVEAYGYDRTFHLGTRAVCREEIEFARHKNIRYLTSFETRFLGLREVARRVLTWLKQSPCKTLYVSVDMDVYDPAYAPGVSTPEPDGLEPWMMLELLDHIVLHSLKPLVAVDVVEVSPPYDTSEITSVLAARTIVELIAAHQAVQQRRSRFT